MFSIRNKTGGEILLLNPGDSRPHPAWVHAQCGTASEAELTALLARLNHADYIRAGGDSGDPRGIFIGIPNGAVAWKRADPFQPARWLFDESDVVEASDLDPDLIVRVGDRVTT